MKTVIAATALALAFVAPAAAQERIVVTGARPARHVDSRARHTRRVRRTGFAEIFN